MHFGNAQQWIRAADVGRFRCKPCHEGRHGADARNTIDRTPTRGATHGRNRAAGRRTSASSRITRPCSANPPVRRVRLERVTTPAYDPLRQHRQQDVRRTPRH
jgi:hypothetical protein